MLTVSSLFTAVAALRYFTNDRGEMVIERGIEKVKGGPGKKLVIRALAAVAATHLLLIVFYNIPNSVIGLHSNEWPADLQERSYLTDFVCGDETDRACPGAAVPNAALRHRQRERRVGIHQPRRRPGHTRGHDGPPGRAVRPR